MAKSFIELALEHEYMVQKASEDDRVKEYVIYPKTIMIPQILTGLLNELAHEGYTIEFDEHSRTYNVNNVNLLKKKQHEVTEELLCIKDYITSNPCYEDLKEEIIAGILATIKETGMDFDKVFDVMFATLHDDLSKFFEENDYKKMIELYDGLFEAIDVDSDLNMILNLIKGLKEKKNEKH